MRFPSLSAIKHPSRARHSRVRLCVAGATVLAALAIGFTFIGRAPINAPNGIGNERTAFVRPVFQIDEIEGIGMVEEVVAGEDGTEESDESKESEESEDLDNLSVVTVNFQSSDIRGAILPHHTLAAGPLMELWSGIKDASNPSVIVIVGPNHENAGRAAVQTTRGVWISPFGNVETDDSLVGRLVSLGIAGEEPDSFANEHAIGTQVPYLARLFPGVPIVPVIAKSTTGEDDARSLALVLRQLLPDDALVVASVDFSHYFPDEKTAEMDAETLAFIAGRRYADIERLGSDHLDAPYATIAFFAWSDLSGYDNDLAWHGSSHAITGNPNAPGTSYLVFLSHSTTQSLNHSLSLSLAGDVMLGRGVASALARTTVERAFASAASAFEGSDLAFANLESVLTASERDTGKQIFFKADPARTDVLARLGLTHVSVANNHVDDYGHGGWVESVGHLLDAGIAPVGDYYNNAVPVVAEAKGKRIVFLAYEDLYRPLDKTRLTSDIIAADALGDVLIVSFHWGEEYAHVPTRRQVDLAHAAIDAGADIIVGHHPHVLQGIETYGGGLILYSLGNFVFDQIGQDENESVVAKITISETERAIDLVPMRIVGTFPRIATDAERKETLARIAGWGNAEIADGIRNGSPVPW